MTGAEALALPADDPDTVSVAAARCARVAALAADLGRDLGADSAALGDAWEGPAAQGCRAELQAAVGLVRSLVDPLHRSAGQLRAHAQLLAAALTEIEALRRQYDELVAEHARRLVVLMNDPELTGPLRRRQVEESWAGHRDELAALHRRHLAVLDRVAADARATGRRLSDAAWAVLPGPRSGRAAVDAHEPGLARLLPLLAAARTAAGVGARPPAVGTAPEAVRQWWAALTSDEQLRATRAWPAVLGRLDGLPASARSAANERRLALEISALRRRPALGDEARRLDTCLLVQAQLDLVRAGDDPVGPAPQTAQLLVFEPAAFGGEGRAAIAVGDVDTADNVAFLVPGLGSDVRTALPGLTGDALLVTAAARRLAPTRSTATVAWVGYDAPGPVEAVVDRAAVSGAGLLAADVLAVQSARVVPPHVTLVGHSYGSTTTGLALRDHRTGVDDAVLLGSPGPDVDRASDLHVPAGHVFVGASSRDPVSYLDRFGGDPSHESFGAVRFQAEDPTRDTWRLDFADHSKYFDAGTESLSNIAHVVTGDAAGVTRAPYRHEQWLLPDGINDDPEADRDPSTVRVP